MNLVCIILLCVVSGKTFFLIILFFCVSFQVKHLIFIYQAKRGNFFSVLRRIWGSFIKKAVLRRLFTSVNNVRRTGPSCPFSHIIF